MRTRREYLPVFKQFMHHCTAEQQRWLIRVILKGQFTGSARTTTAG